MDPPPCSPQELALSAQHGALFHCLARDETIALSFSTMTSTLSLTACVVTFALVLRNVLYHARKNPGNWRLIKVPMDIYLLSLFAGEMILALGGLLSGKWVRDGKLGTGRWCTAQGIMLSAGPIIAASSILAIAIHTFVMVWCNRGFRALKLAYIVTSLPWLFSIVYLAKISSVHRAGPDTLFRPAPYWCWVGKQFMVHRIFAVYGWLWLSLLISIVIYVPLFFWGRGNITIGDHFWSFEIHGRQMIDDPDGVRRRALRMIAYPLVFALLIVPLSVGRWIGFVQENRGDRKNHVPPTALIAIHTIYGFSGVANVALFLLTRPGLLLFSRGPKDADFDAVVNYPTGDTDSIENHSGRQAGKDRDQASATTKDDLPGYSGYRNPSF